ncbi:MAG: hypothetical protein HYX32_01390 [Actinobacteria bacterium]|nr:hypothetical protein [Actinomycetota bacterium]
MIRPMHADDFDWAATLMQQRRERYAEFSPVFWRPAANITAGHAQFMRSTAAREGAVAIRTDAGFALSYPHEGRCFVDDFAVDGDDRWAVDGRELLLAVWSAARSSQQQVLRVVTARRDEPKRSMMIALGLEVGARWWVKELSPAGDASTWGPVTVGDVDALIGPAPPVYDPGGPVCLLGDVDPSRAGQAADAAAELGAVLAVVQREFNPVESEPVLEAAGFHNPSEFYEGDPSTEPLGA